MSVGLVPFEVGVAILCQQCFEVCATLHAAVSFCHGLIPGGTFLSLAELAHSDAVSTADIADGRAGLASLLNDPQLLCGGPVPTLFSICLLGRYWIASATCAARICSLPARSAIVRQLEHAVI